ncbi:MAG: hypothetical protein E7366_01245 [Clostridiales bacterium]|nr:hypothetical protein [Clostridiales bacterium]
MKKTFAKILLIAALGVSMAMPAFSNKAATVTTTAEFTTTATGYKKASDVKYVTSGSYIANWGARGEDCSFLSTYATSFYTGSYTYSSMSTKSGGSTQSNAHQSSLYSTLKTLMTSKHTHQTSYSETKSQYRYTDCVSNDTEHISSFYSGKQLTGNWDGAATWNREHTWPNSKGLGGNDENDIMMLRPTWVKENSSRGNTAYGESSGYYDPNGEGANVRGDCARIVLYVYVRWGNTNYMWGKGGVMESMNVLLDWMEEDPVDTWEMGRNDAVQKITGTRNVFVDYPEYAWLLFGKAIPKNMSTPSGIANNGSSSTGSSSSSSNSSSSSDTDIDQDQSSSSSGSSSSGGGSGELPGSSFDKPGASSSTPEIGGDETCTHEYCDWITITMPTQTTEGEQLRACQLCGKQETKKIPCLKTEDSGDTGESATNSSEGGTEGCAHEYCDWITITMPTETTEGEQMRACQKCGDTQTRAYVDPSEEEKNEPVDNEQTKEGCNSSMQSATLIGGLLLACGVLLVKRKEQTNE